MDEWSRLEGLTTGEFLPYVNKDAVSILVLEDETEIMAAMMVMKVTHLEGFYVSPKLTKNGGSLRGALRTLWAETFAIAKSWGSRWAMAAARTDQMRAVLKLAERDGTKMVNMRVDIYFLSLEG
jgi:hypothetical protein